MNPKGIVEGKCPIFRFNNIAHAPMGLSLMYFISHRYFPAHELIELIKGAFDPLEMVVRNFHGKIILNLVPKAIVVAFNP